MFVLGVCLLLLLAQMISVQIWLTVDSCLINHLNLSLYLNDYELVIGLAGLEKTANTYSIQVFEF